jgi:hypothetical protein
MSFWKVGPTELRLLLAAGNVTLLVNPDVALAGTSHRLFDAGGFIGIVGLAVTVIVAFTRNLRTLYRDEPLRHETSPRRDSNPSPFPLLADGARAGRRPGEGLDLPARTV